MNLLIMGPAGSGKGTQAAKIVEKYGLKHITSGGLLREEAAKDTERSKMIQNLMDEGELIPIDIINVLIKEVIESTESGVIIDGYPRNMEQAEWLDQNLKIDRVIVIKLSDEVALKRISGRRLCKDCGEMFHVDFNPPQEAGKCDLCGGELYQRKDDCSDSVIERLKIYHTQTDAAISFFKKKGLVEEIDGNQSIADVWTDIEKVLGE